MRFIRRSFRRAPMCCVLQQRHTHSVPLAARRERAAAGPVGNSRLTALTAIPLLVLLAAEGLTLLSLRSFLEWHVFLGMLLVPIVVLKLASTGYRFYRYYTGRRDYVEAGPPPILLRLLGPLVVTSTAALFASGVALAALRPGDSIVLLLHKASFVIWVGALGLHVLGHIVRIPGLTAPDLKGDRTVPGSSLRLSLVAAAVALGAIVAVMTLPLALHWAQWIQTRG
jgi:hypothetical protein